MGFEFKNDIHPTSGDNGVKCPLVDFEIEKNSCLENTMVVAGFMDDFSMLGTFKKKENWREICQNCKYFNF